MTSALILDEESLPAENQPLRGKNVLVTGAASDIGHHVCVALTEAGASLQLLDRRQRMMTALHDEILQSGGTQPLLIELDMMKAEYDHMEELAAGLTAEGIEVDGCVHLPLTAAPLSPIVSSKIEDWIKSWESIYLKPAMLARALLSNRRQHSVFRLIFSSIDQGRNGSAYWSAPGPAFAALENFSEIINQEFDLAQSFTLDLDKTETSLRHKYYPAEAKSKLRKLDHPLVAGCFVYLLSDAASALNDTRIRLSDPNG